MRSSEEDQDRGSDHLVDSGFIGDFAVTGEPTNLHIGVEAKGVLAVRLVVSGRARTRRNALGGRQRPVLKALDVFRSIESLPVLPGKVRSSSTAIDQPRPDLGGGDALNKVPDRCVIDVDIRYLPGQDPVTIMAQIGEHARRRDPHQFHSPPGDCRSRLALCNCPARGGGAPPHRSADDRRARRRLRRGLVPACRGPRSGVRGPRAAATTVRKSGSRSLRWTATATTLDTFLRAIGNPEG